MTGLINQFRGTVKAEITGASPQDLLNRLNRAGIPFWDITRVSDFTIRISMYASGYRNIRQHAKKAMCRVRLIEKNGLPFQARRIKKRWILIAGAIFCVLLTITLQRFVWTFEVQGNETIPDEQILRALDELGIGVGMRGSQIKPQEIKHQMLLKIPELSWLTINVSGGRATVLVKERIQTPEIPDETASSILIASRTGVITKVEVLSGQARIEPGQTVLEGEVLISGVMDVAPNLKRSRAIGEVYARTWYTLTAAIPVNYEQKSYTGAEKSKYSLIIGDKRIKLYINGGISFEEYDKIIEEYHADLPGGVSFPLALVRETCAEYVGIETEIEQKDGEVLLKQYLLSQIEGQMSGGVIRRSSFDTQVRDGLLILTAVCECEEQIGVERLVG